VHETAVEPTAALQAGSESESQRVPFLPIGHMHRSSTGFQFEPAAQ